MLTLKTTAHVDENGQLTLQLTEKLPPGEYDLVVVVDEKPLPTQKTRKPLVFANHQFPLPEGETFRREDIYGEDGR